MKIVVVGGGILGLTAAWHLARAEHEVIVLEGGDRLGGLAADVEVEGVAIDRFYHCILNADIDLLHLIDAVGLRDQLRMKPVRAGFFSDGSVYSVSTPVDLLRFAPLKPVDRLRLVKSLLACRRVRDWEALEQIDVETWLRQQSGDRVFDAVWRPLLSAKFDGNFRNTPATYIWSRTVRMTDTRSSDGRKELAGHLVGGYRTLVERLAEMIHDPGGEIRLNEPAEQLRTDGAVVSGVKTSNGWIDCDAAILTIPLPLSHRLLSDRLTREPESPQQQANIDQYVSAVGAMQGYLGVICPVLLLRRSLSPYYTLYLADQSLPFTAVIETTNLIDPDLVGGHHLVYLPKYVDPDSELFKMSDDEIRTWFLDELRRVFPDFNPDDLVASPVFRAHHVEPLHPIGSFGTVPPVRTPIEGLWLGSTKHFYPRLNNGDAVVGLGTGLAQQVAAYIPPDRAADAAEIEMTAVAV